MINGSVRGDPTIALGPRPARPATRRLSGARAAVLDALIAAGGPVRVAVLADQLGQHPNTVREHLDALVATGRTERLRSDPIGRGRPAWLYRARDSAGAADGNDPATGGDEYAALATALIDQVVTTNPDPREMARQAGERWGRTLVEQRLDRAARTGTVGSASRVASQRSGESHGENSTQTSGTNPKSGTDRNTGKNTNKNTDASTTEQAGDQDGPDPVAAVVGLLSDLRFEPKPAGPPAAFRLTTCPLLEAARRNPDVVCQVHLGIVRGVLERLGSDPDGTDLVPFAEPGACRLTLPLRQ